MTIAGSLLRAAGRALPLAATIAGAACGDGAAESAPAGRHADETFEAGPFAVQPGKEIVMCTFVRGDNAEAQDVSLFTTDQSVGGHHLIVYTIDHAVDLPPGPCSQGGQPNWSQIIATQAPHQEHAFPAGVGYHIAAKQQYVMETHFINTTGAVEEAKSAFSLTYAPKQSVTAVAASYFFGTQNIDSPPGAQWTTSATCKPPAAMTLRTMFGHEHQHGTEVSVDLFHAGATKPIYRSTEWDAPPVAEFEGGVALAVDDALRVSCAYDNTTSVSLRFPHEMCFALGYFWPSDGNEVFCVSGGGSDACTCQNTFTDAGPGGSTIAVEVSRQAAVAGTKGDPASGAPLYCTLFRAEDYTLLGPKPDAKPYGFASAIDAPLSTTSDRVPLEFDDVTPGDYAVVCLMDTIGGGFLPGSGDLVNAKETIASPALGMPASVDVVLDYALP